ncbi:MAG: response regulator [Verrucomicrobia bacterium]|nr:response regulator [Verrucomicrobiota bacterium]
MASSVLIVDDEPDVIDLVKIHLKKAGYQVLTALNGATGLDIARRERPDVIVLDLMLPGMTGIEVCRELRRHPETATLGVVMLTAKGQPSERIAGLETGADDYVTKPFSPKELVLRVQAVERRTKAAREGAGVVESGDVRIDKGAFEITVAGRRLDLTTTEFKLLTLLVERRGQVQSRDTLLRDVWGYENLIDTRTVDTHIRRLREKLGERADRIETQRGEGYRFLVQ